LLPQIDRQAPKGKALHLIADNYATHKHPTVQAWLDKHPRFHMHFTPTSASWLNMVERLLRHITTERLRRGMFASVPELVTAIDEYVEHHNINPKPFIWIKSVRDILQKVICANSRLNPKHRVQHSTNRQHYKVLHQHNHTTTVRRWRGPRTEDFPKAQWPFSARK
jgi:transposase